MVLIILSWIYILFTTINLGFILDRILVLKNKNFVITSFLGLFSVTVLASIWSIFGRINVEFHIFLLLINLLFLFKFKMAILYVYKEFWLRIQSLRVELKVYLVLITTLIIAQCSTLPYVIDNESYYIQTIKWFNEYGFVKGIANLHLYLGQASGWHIAQSVFNFSFLYSNFNDLSGFSLLLGVLFSVEKLNQYYENKNFDFLLIGVFPLASIYFFQFIAAPSPDIPVYVLTFIIIFYFIENFQKCSSEIFNLIVILTLFMLYIKSTSIVFVLLPIILLVKNHKTLLRKLLVPSIIAFLILALFVIKNMIVSGSVLFPSKMLESFTTEYSIQKAIESNYYDLIKFSGYNVYGEQFNSMSSYELFLHWLSMPKLHGIFNKIGIILILLSPFFIYKFQNKKSYWIIYVLMVLQMILLLATSPQFRFFANFSLFFGLFCLICFFRNRKLITTFLFLSLFPMATLLFVPIQLTQFTTNKFMAENNNFSYREIVFPLENTKSKTEFEVITIGNLKYNSPLENEFFYGTGNGDLPCVNKTQVEYYQKYFGVIPQMRSDDLKDGFYSKRVEKDE